MWERITSNVGQRAPAKDGNGGQKKEDTGQKKEDGRIGAVGMIGAVAVLTPVVTGLIGVGGRIGGVLGAAFLERPRVFPRIFRKTATGRYRETERQEQ